MFALRLVSLERALWVGVVILSLSQNVCSEPWTRLISPFLTSQPSSKEDGLVAAQRTSDCRDPPCANAAIRGGATDSYTGVHSDRSILGQMVPFLGIVEVIVNRISRMLLPTLVHNFHEVYPAVVKLIVPPVLKGIVKTVELFTNFKFYNPGEDCAIIVKSIDREIGSLGHLKITDWNICGLKTVDSELMKKTFLKTHWLFDNFIHFKNTKFTVGELETSIQLLENFNLSSSTVSLKNVTFHFYFTVPVGALPVIAWWTLKVDNPRGFTIGYGKEAGVVKRTLAWTTTRAIRQVLANSDLFVSTLNFVVTNAVKAVTMG